MAVLGGRSARDPLLARWLRPQDYSADRRYRPPSPRYARISRLVGVPLTSLGARARGVSPGTSSVTACGGARMVAHGIIDVVIWQAPGSMDALVDVRHSRPSASPVFRDVHRGAGAAGLLVDGTRLPV